MPAERPARRTEWPVGTRVAVLDRSARMVGAIMYPGSPCPEDGEPTYRVRFDNGLEADMCSTLLFPVQQTGPKVAPKV
jgi:hypothetical protein